MFWHTLRQNRVRDGPGHLEGFSGACVKIEWVHLSCADTHEEEDGIRYRDGFDRFKGLSGKRAARCLVELIDKHHHAQRAALGQNAANGRQQIRGGEQELLLTLCGKDGMSMWGVRARNECGQNATDKIRVGEERPSSPRLAYTVTTVIDAVRMYTFLYLVVEKQTMSISLTSLTA